MAKGAEEGLREEMLLLRASDHGPEEKACQARGMELGRAEKAPRECCWRGVGDWEQTIKSYPAC